MQMAANRDKPSNVVSEHGSHMLNLLNEDRNGPHNFCDLKLQTEGQDFYVHKCIVGISSDFFGSMLRSEMQERYAETVPIPSTTVVRLTIILDFIYTGVVSLNCNNVYDVLGDADYMQLQKLKHVCETFLVENISPENCLKIRSYSQRFRLDDALEKADHVIKHNMTRVLRHDDFLQLTHDDVKDIMMKKSSQIPQDTIYHGIVRWVKNNEENRRDFFTNLFSEIDLVRLPNMFLQDVVLTEDLVSSSPDCLKALLQVLFTQVNPQRCASPYKDSSCSWAIGGVGTETDFVQIDENFNVTHLPKLNLKRIGATVSAVKQRIYVIGGGSTLGFKGNPHGSVVAYDVSASRGKWTVVGTMKVARQHAASAMLNGYIYVTGGGNQSGYLSSCERYDSVTDSWSLLNEMNEQKAFHALVNVKGGLFCIGGCNEHRHFASVQRYDHVTDTWCDVTPMGVARSGLAAVVLDDMIYAIGGFSGKCLSAVERYDPIHDKWKLLGNLNTARNRPSAFIRNQKIYVIGGQDDTRNTLRSIEVYNRHDDTWTVCSETIDTHIESVVSM